MNTRHRQLRHAGATSDRTPPLALVALLALVILSAVASAPQSPQGSSKPASNKAQTQKHDTTQPASGTAQPATGQEPAKTNTTPQSGTGGQGARNSGQAPQGGAQEPFVMPNQPMCPCPLVTKDPVEPKFQAVCGRCHTPERITGIKKSGLEWKETIDKMILKGAQVSDDDYDVILAFLVRNFDRVDINWVESGELVVALGLSTDEAEKIVAYRKEHGDFKDYDSLTKVPGIDVKKLEAKKSSIVFQ